MAFLGKRLKDERELMKWSQQDLADRSGITRQQISRYERDQIEPSATAVVRLCQALDISTDYLLGIVDEKGGERHLSVDDAELLQLYRSNDFMKLMKFVIEHAEQFK